MSNLQFDSISGDCVRNFKKLPDGSLLAWLRVARTGELDYGSHKQTVPAETLFDSESMRSLVGVPVTLEHPPGMVLSLAERRKYSVGTVLQEIVQENHDSDPSYLTAAAIIWDEATIEALEKGNLREISSGYFAEKEPLSDSVYKQTKREYNHIAITSAGRAGSEVRALIDTPVAELVSLHQAHRDSLVAAGIEPDYNWDKLTLLQKVVTALSNQDASSLSLKECQAVLDFRLPKSQPSPLPQTEAPKDFEGDYMLRLTQAYRKLK